MSHNNYSPSLRSSLHCSAIPQQRPLFGTDGIRGTANCDPVTPEIAFRLARAVGHLFRSKNKCHVVIGRDTRCSGDMLEAALIAGLHSIGANAILAGILPTPAIAHLTREEKADAGIVISASHNPAKDNGLKIFRGDGYKLDDALEQRLEQLILTPEIDTIRPIGTDLGKTLLLTDALDRYVEAAKKSVPSLSLSGFKIALDCAHGASCHSSPRILEELGAKIFPFYSEPNGAHINDVCGSMHPKEISRLTLSSAAHLGISHDGDADRLILCDEEGHILDGDEILAITALHALRSGTLSKNTLVATVMSNFGLDECLASAGGKVLRTPVGDRHVIEAMLKNDLNIGGEQSGHLIFRDYSTTGDGIIAALQVLQIMEQSGKSLSELKHCLKKYPQAQRHLCIKEKPPLESLEEVMLLVKKIEQDLLGHGRVLLRYSGTEPLIRLLIEGPDEVFINKQADEIIKALAIEIGEK